MITGMPVKGSLYDRISRSIKPPDENYRYTGTFSKDDGMLFSYTLNKQKDNCHYLYRGTLTLKSPATRQPLKIIDLDKKTGRQVQRPASMPLHINLSNGTTLKEEIASEIEKGAIALCEKYQCQFASHVKGSVSLNQMPLRVVANYYLEEAAQEQCKKSDARKAFCSRIRHIAENLKDIPIENIGEKELMGAVSDIAAAQQSRYLSALLRFLQYVEKELQASCPLVPVVMGCQNTARTGERDARKKRNEQAVLNPDVLDEEAEAKFNAIVQSHEYDPMHIALLLVKGSGLAIAECCELRLGDLEFTREETELFIRLFRSFASATQNYTFPVFPYEAMVLRQYVTYLSEQYGKSRTEPDRFLFSQDREGRIPLEPGEVGKLCRIVLSGLPIWCANMAKNRGMKREPGQTMLQNTYEYRLGKYCNILQQTDNGAYLFMMHRTLANDVLADHYRCFTGESGRAFLMSRVQMDQRDIPERRHRQSVREHTDADGISKTFFSQSQWLSEQNHYILSTGTDGHVVINAPAGCRITVSPKDGPADG